MLYILSTSIMAKLTKSINLERLLDSNQQASFNCKPEDFPPTVLDKSLI